MRRALASAAMMCAAVIVLPAAAQSLDERLDEDRYLRGLIELQLPEVLDEYLRLHPPADAVAAAEHQVAAEAMALRQPGLIGEDRARRIERLLERRRSLINENPEHPRRPIWLADQAADLYFHALGGEALWLLVQLGSPSAEQRRRARDLARDMLVTAQQAELAIEEAILTLESAPGFGEDLAAQMHRRRLVEDEHDRRIPFLHGVAAHLAALTDAEVGRRDDLLRTAAALLEETAPRLEGAHSARAALHAGMARLDLAQHREATERLASAGESPDAEPIVRRAARLALAAAGAAQRGTDSGVRRIDEFRANLSRDDVLWHVLAADQHHRLLREAAAAGPPARRDRALADSYQPYVELLDADLALSDMQRRRLVFSRLVDAIDPDIAADALPPLLRIALAEQLARDEESRADAVAVLENLLDDEEAIRSGRERALALFTLGRTLSAVGRTGDAVRRFITVSREHPAAPEAEPSMELAASMAAHMYHQSPRAGGPLLREALDVLLDQYANLPAIDRWKLLAGQLALREGRLADAHEHFASVAAGSQQWYDAAALRVETERRAAQAEDDEQAARSLWGRTLSACIEARPILMRGLAAAGDVGRAEALHSYLAMLRIAAAEALLALDEPASAIDELDGIEREDGLDPALLARASHVRIDARRALGEWEQAWNEVDRLLGDSPQRAAGILLPMMTRTEQRVLALIDDLQESRAEEIAARELAPLAERIERWLNSAGVPAEALALRPRVAEAYRHAGQYPQALGAYERLLREQSSAAPYLFGRAECLFHLGRDDSDDTKLAEAMRIYRRLASAGGEAGERYYWPSQLRMLQILDAVGRNTEQIMPRIQQLRQRDRDLGGERFRREFEQLQARYMDERNRR